MPILRTSQAGFVPSLLFDTYLKTYTESYYSTKKLKMSKSKIWNIVSLTALMLLTLIMTGCDKDSDDLRPYDLSALTIDDEGNLRGTIKVTERESLTLSYRTHGGTGTATSTDIVLGAPDASGKVAVISSIDKTPRVIQISIDGYATSRQITLGTVPAGFLTGQASERMDLDEAREFCLFHGGRLPLIANTKEYPWDVYGVALETKNYPTVDGFGHLFDTWPADVPVGFPPYEEVSYWTDTKDTYYGDIWMISPAYNDATKVFYSAPGANFPGIKYAVICLP